MEKYYLAIDIGASSGRHILGSVKNGKILLEEVYRFDNILVQKDKELCWDTQSLFTNIKNGLIKCREIGKIPTTMAIDTWGVDFVLLDEQNCQIGNATSYRDKRTQGQDIAVSQKISFQKLYKKTGIQMQIFNTIFQLSYLQEQKPNDIKKAHSLLMMPDYFSFLLTGVKKQEYTNATTTNLVNAEQKTWDSEILSALNLPSRLFGALSMPGEVVGAFTGTIQDEIGFNCTVILPATHDTGSAFLAVPACDDNAIYISSGTWSLLGVENESPITSPESEIANFSNEGGYDYRYRYLKNIMGLWMIQSIRRNLDKKYSFAQLEEYARNASGFTSLVNVNDDSFLAPINMIDAIAQYCQKTNQTIPASIGETMQCVYQSLASCYAATINELQTLTNKKYTSINIVGGGSKDSYLNELTSKHTNLPVYSGPSEGTALGNIIVQLIVDKQFKTLQNARAAIKNSFEIKEIKL